MHHRMQNCFRFDLGILSHVSNALKVNKEPVDISFFKTKDHVPGKHFCYLKQYNGHNINKAERGIENGCLFKDMQKTTEYCALEAVKFEVNLCSNRHQKIFYIIDSRKAIRLVKSISVSGR